jgi:hypothetical protein
MTVDLFPVRPPKYVELSGILSSSVAVWAGVADAGNTGDRLRRIGARCPTARPNSEVVEEIADS